MNVVIRPVLNNLTSSRRKIVSISFENEQRLQLYCMMQFPTQHILMYSYMTNTLRGST